MSFYDFIVDMGFSFVEISSRITAGALSFGNLTGLCIGMGGINLKAVGVLS